MSRTDPLDPQWTNINNRRKISMFRLPLQFSPITKTPCLRGLDVVVDMWKKRLLQGRLKSQPNERSPFHWRIPIQGRLLVDSQVRAEQQTVCWLNRFIGVTCIVWGKGYPMTLSDSVSVEEYAQSSWIHFIRIITLLAPSTDLSGCVIDFVDSLLLLGKVSLTHQLWCTSLDEDWGMRDEYATGESRS